MQLMTPSQPLTHNMLSGASPASPPVSPISIYTHACVFPSLSPSLSHHNPPATNAGISGAYLNAAHFLNAW